MPTSNEIENARRDALVKKENEAYEKQLKKEREENEAPRKAVREALSFLGLGAKLMPSGSTSKEKQKEKSFAESVGEAARKNLPSKEGGMKKGGRVGSARASGSVKKKRYAEGGEIAAQQPTYPFYGNQPAASTTQPAEGVSQTFNIQPGMSSADMGFKKGGRVRTASQRADGCAIRGKTRAR